jgi:HAD superfamily hydrolase (TIGR01484 family)
MKNKIAENLYITDLDGTLLNQDGELSDYTKNVLKSLIEKGVQFSIATGRPLSLVSKVFDDITLTVPLVISNGVLVYDMTTKQYVKSFFIDSLQCILKRSTIIRMSLGLETI